ncbi:hypothetical protein AMECASPLE_005439, partial [Ameca splendens]
MDPASKRTQQQQSQPLCLYMQASFQSHLLFPGYRAALTSPVRVVGKSALLFQHRGKSSVPEHKNTFI